MRIILLSCLVLALTGCGPSVSKVSFVRPNNSALAEETFEFVDNRPPNERKYSVTNMGGYSMKFQLGDDYINPNIAELFKSQLAISSEGKLKGHKVILESAQVSIEAPFSTIEEGKRNERIGNTYSPGVGGGSGVAGQLLASWLISALEHAKDENNINITISGKIDDKLPFQESTYSSYTSGSGEPEVKAAILDVIEKSSRSIMDGIK